jgi:hypothetical protein
MDRHMKRSSPTRASTFALAWICAFVVAIACTAPPVHADDEAAGNGDNALPGRVGRIANVQGPLYHARDENAGEWSEIGQNDPVAQGDNLWVDRDGHAEIDYGGGQFRLGGDTNVHVSRLDERQLALFIAAGRVIVRVRVLEPDDGVSIDTPATQIALTRPGLYRIDVDADAAETTLIVREGEAEVATAAGTEQVLPGQTALLRDAPSVTADIRNGAALDGFDTWSASRDRVYERPRRNAYVSRQMIGQADLDTYGSWQMYPDYGAVWFPTVETDWAPYRFGHWTWLPGWGYTWVDDAPWGYAPFHYGRWVYVTGRWGWCPGAFVVRPLWAPALVAWYGGGAWGYSASFGAPVYGWVPLGWREPFVPWWRGCSSRCYDRYNRPYGVDVAQRRTVPPARFANWSVPGGVTAVPSAALSGGRPVARNRVPVAPNASFTPALVTAPPTVAPAAPRPANVRPGVAPPLPASSVQSARAPAAAALPAPRPGSLQPLPPQPYARSPVAPPAASGAVAPNARGPDARNVTPPGRPVPAVPAERAMRIAPPAASPAPTAPQAAPAQRAAPPPVQRIAPAPVPQVAPPAPAYAPGPRAAPMAPAPSAPVPLPRSAPAPLPAPVAPPPAAPPPAVAPAAVVPPAAAERGAARPVPKAPERPN